MKTFAFATIISAALLLPVYAQTPAPAPTKMPETGQRKINQQNRIANGVKSGQLTAKETGHLEHREADLNKATAKMRAANGGKLTAADKKNINARENNISNKIHTAKHNSTTRASGEKNK